MGGGRDMGVGAEGVGRRRALSLSTSAWRSWSADWPVGAFDLLKMWRKKATCSKSALTESFTCESMLYMSPSLPRKSACERHPVEWRVRHGYRALSGSVLVV